MLASPTDLLEARYTAERALCDAGRRVGILMTRRGADHASVAALLRACQQYVAACEAVERGMREERR